VDAEVTGRKEYVGFYMMVGDCLAIRVMKGRRGDRGCTKPIGMTVPKLK
jgi:hypothetical protein